METKNTNPFTPTQPDNTKLTINFKKSHKASRWEIANLIEQLYSKDLWIDVYQNNTIVVYLEQGYGHMVGTIGAHLLNNNNGIKRIKIERVDME